MDTMSQAPNPGLSEMETATRPEADPAAFSFAYFKARAEELVPLVMAEADEAERLRHMTDTVVRTFQETGLYRMLMPRELGGAELPLPEAMQVVETISHADGSTGWCLMVGNIQSASGGAFLSDAGVARVFADGPDVMIAGQGIPRGFAHRVDGGYQIHGDWSYGSGIYHAEYIHTGCVLMQGDAPVMHADGMPEVLICHVPRKQIQLKDNWDVLGLRGTGSFDYSIADLFVPEEMTHSIAIREPHRGGNQYTLGLTGYTAWGHTTFALGVGRRALDEIAELARTKENVFGRLCDGASFQESYARNEAMYRSVRAFCYSVWDDLSDTLGRDEPASLEQIALIRLAMRYLHEVVSDVCTFAYKAGAGVSLRGGAFQRCYRDIHAGTQHILLSDQIVQDCGKVLMGAASENATWTILGLR